MHSFQKNIFWWWDFLLRFSLPFCKNAVSLSTFLKLSHALFVKNCTVISHSAGYSVVKEHFGPDSLDLFIRSYSPAEFFQPSILDCWEITEKLTPTVKLFLGRLFSPHLLSGRKLFVLSQVFFTPLKSGIKNPSRALAREGAYLLLYKKSKPPVNRWFAPPL